MGDGRNPDAGGAVRGFLSGISRFPHQSRPSLGKTPQNAVQTLAERVSTHPDPSPAPEEPATRLQGIQVDPRGTRTQLGRNRPAKTDVSTPRYDFDFPLRPAQPHIFNGRFQ